MNMFGRMFGMAFSIEIIYSFVIIISSLMIYFGTKELYELSSHKGIKYFRQAFLFFALAYFFRSFIKLLVIYFNNNLLDISPSLFSPLLAQAALFSFMYFSSIAIFYLLYGLIYKKVRYQKIIFVFHLIAIMIAFVSIIYRNPFVYLGLNFFLLFFVLFIVFLSYKYSRKSKNFNMYIIYILLLLFWILNIIDILIPRFFKTFQLIVYLLSITIFQIMVYKVLKKAGSN